MTAPLTQEQIDEGKRYVAVQRIHVQVSADYASEPRTRVLVLTPETTVAEVMAWSVAGNVLGRGDVSIIEEYRHD